MAIETDNPGFTSVEFIAHQHNELVQRLGTLPLGEAATVAFILPDPDSPSLSYAIEARAQCGTRGLGSEIWIPGFDGTYQNVQDIAELRVIRNEGLYVPASDGATLELIDNLNRRKDTDLDGVVPLTVSTAIAEAIDPDLDLDAVRSDAKHTPATPESMADVADLMLPAIGVASIHDLKPEEIVVLGNGGVCGPLVAKTLLDRYGKQIPPANHYKSREDLPAGAARLATDDSIKLGFTATRAAGNIRALTPGTVLVDFGYAELPDGRQSGNAHPALLKEHGTDGKQILAFRDLGGPNTITRVYARAADHRLGRAILAGQLAAVS